MGRLLVFALLGWIVAASTAHAQTGSIEIRDAWVRPTPGGAKTAAVYLTAVNHGTATDRITAVETPAAASADMHVDIMDGNVMRMRHVVSVDVPANGRSEERRVG